MIKHPKDLITHTRFDLLMKYMYAKAIVEGYDTEFFKDMYKEHIRIWNGFKEYNNPNKNSFEKYDEEFHNIIESFKDKGFKSEISKIPVIGNHILNGAHRTAAALALNKAVIVREGKNAIDGQYDCGWGFFKSLKLPEVYANRTAIEYASLKPNTHMVMVFPSAKGHRDKVLSILNKYGRVFYYRDVNITGSLNLMKELYAGEPWGGTFEDNYGGLEYKARLCYPTPGITTGYLVEFDNLNQAVKAKAEIRSIYGIGKNSVHINDTHPETVRIAKLIFNDNSIHHLNNAKIVNFKKFNKCIEDFKKIINNRGLNIDDYCVTASSTLSIYGLREGNDLDYLHNNPVILHDPTDLIHSHNSYGVGRYHLDRDEIIYNPENHFYSMGVKFASLDVVKKLKEKRGEPKDKVDIDLINKIL